MPRHSKTHARGLHRFKDSKGRTRYRIDLRWRDPRTNEPRRHQQQLPPDVKLAEAKRRVREILNAAESGAFKKKAVADAGTVAAALDRYMKWSEEHRPKSLASRRSLVNVLKRHMGTRKLSELSEVDIQRFKTKRRKELIEARVERAKAKGVSPARAEAAAKEAGFATINRALALLKHVLKLAAKKWQIMRPEQAAMLREIGMLPEPQSRERRVEGDELVKVLDALEERFRPIVLASMYCGQRRGNVAGLKKSEVNLKRGWITLRHTKSGKSYSVPITPGLRAVLDEAIARSGDSEWVFPAPSGEAYHPDTITNAWIRAKKAAGLKPAVGPESLRLHDLRREFGSQLIESGEDVAKVMKLLGHSQITTTQRYLNVADESLAVAAAKVRIPGA